MMWGKTEYKPKVDDLTALAGMTVEQLAILDAYTKRAYTEGREFAFAQESHRSSRVNRHIASIIRLGMLVGVLGGTSLLVTGLIRAATAPYADPPEPKLEDPRNQWVLQGTAVDGADIYIREPADGVRCYMEYANDGSGKHRLGCVIIDQLPIESMP